MKKFAIIYMSLLACGMIGNFFFPEAGHTPEIEAALQAPDFSSWMGRDSLGRDLLSRVFEGAQVSVMLGLASSMMAVLMGVLYGGLSGLSKKFVDSGLMRICEVLMALPSVMLMAVLALVFKSHFSDSNLLVMFWVLALGSWMPVARLTRNLILQEKHRDYVEAAIAIGATDSRVFRKHILPNLISPLLIYWSLQVPSAILAEGLLSFLGFGIKSPGVSWGALLQEGWKTLASFPHLLLGPSVILFLTIFSLNILLEGFRRNMDPKLKWEKFS